MHHDPLLYCPFEAALHPEHAAVEAAALAWARRFDLCSRDAEASFRAARFGHLAARTHHWADGDGLRLALDWIVWLFARDDRVDAAHRSADVRGALIRGDDLRALLDEGSRLDDGARSGALAGALHDIRRRVVERGGAGWWTRMAAHVRDYLDANAWELENQREGRAPDVHSYVALRRASGAVRTTIALGACLAGVPSDAPWLDHLQVRTLADLANDHVCWVNDLRGLDKEMAEGHRNNLVLVLEAHERIPLEEARRLTARRCDEVMAAYRALEARLPHFGRRDGEVRAYQRVLRSWMRGNLDWYGDTRRYEAPPGSPFLSAVG
ncbi:MAG TPA: hypothetical protein RMH99_03620 [Sandaracinaceae bacterium LLY-WYZ-13_1]|nr:hypothetical protein [Sandaracinaceae bacterium LLY-WYZ-13_1]